MNADVHRGVVNVAAQDRHDGGVMHAHVEVARVDVHEDECFDPDSCCDARERALIMRLRQVLRPLEAPEGLLARVERTLDRCCLEEPGVVHGGGEVAAD